LIIDSLWKENQICLKIAWKHNKAKFPMRIMIIYWTKCTLEYDTRLSKRRQNQPNILPLIQTLFYNRICQTKLRLNHNMLSRNRVLPFTVIRQTKIRKLRKKIKKKFISKPIWIQIKMIIVSVYIWKTKKWKISLENARLRLFSCSHISNRHSIWRNFVFSKTSRYKNWETCSKIVKWII